MVGCFENWRGLIDKPILELLTFGSDPDFNDFESKTSQSLGTLALFWLLAQPEIMQKLPLT